MMTRNSPLLSYGVALLSVALALAVSLLFSLFIQPTPLALFYMAVIVSAWYGGMKPGLVATVLSTLAINYFIPPYNSLSIVNPGNLLRLGVFVIVALLISGLEQARRVALQQEQQLRVEAETAHRRTAHLLEHMTDAFVAFDRHWRYTYANPAALQLLQKSPEELIGKNVWEVFPSEKGGFTYQQLHRALEEQVSLSWEEFGEPVQRWLEVRAYPSPEGIAIYFQDISERKQAEAALRQNEEQLRLATEGANLGLWHWDVLHDRLVWTDQCKALFGLPADTETSYQVFLNAIHPDDRQRVQEMRPVLEDGQLEHHEIEYRTLWSDGTVRWLMARGSASYDADGKALFSRGVVFDITDRKQAEIAIHEAEERLKLAVEAGRMIAWEWNPCDDSLITSANFPEIYGATDIQTVEQGIALLHPEDQLPHRAIVEQAVETKSEYYCEFRIIRPDTGAIVWMEERAQPILNPDGTLQKFIGVSIDISDRRRDEDERKRIEEELRKSEQQLRSAIEVAQFSPYEWNPVTDELIWDAQLKAMWGLSPDAEVNYAVHNAGLHPEDREYVEQQAAKAIAPNGDGIFEAEFRVIGIEDGVERWISARGQTFFDAERRPVYYVGAAQDISDRKRVEEDLRRSEAAFRTISNAAPALVWVCSPKGENILFNDRWYEFTGQTEAEAFGLGWAETMHPDDAARILPYWKRCQQTGETYEGEVRYRRYDGEYRWHVFRALPRRNADGAIEAWYGLSVDISDRKRIEDERKQAEIALRESEARFRNMADHAPFMVWVTDSTGYCTYLSQSWYDFSGQTPETGLGFGWLEAVHPDDQESSRATFLAANDRHESFRLEYRLRRKDGEYSWAIDAATPWFGEDGQYKGYVGSVIDISDRKQIEVALRQNEDRLRLAIEAAQLGTWDWNLSTNELSLDEVGKTMFGLLPEAEASFEACFETLHSDDRERLEQAVQWSFNPASSGTYDAEYRTVNLQDGAERWIKAKGQVYFDPTGHPRRFIGTLLDITEQKRSETEREQLLAREQAARETAEAANRIKDEFLAVVSHELRSPLNPILGWSRLLRTRQLDQEKTDRALEVIERNAQMQAQLINDLLDVSRILRGKLSLDPKPVDLVFTIQAAMETVRLAAEAKSIQICTQFDPGVGQVAGDAGRLQQVVWNLLSNAVKFTSEGGRVDIQLEGIDAHAQITVRDTGKGIPPDFLPYVFDQFRQESSTTTRRFGGLGLGLAIVRYLVELHGGTVQADSPGEGQGATFIVKLPLMPHQPTTNQDTKPSEPSLNLQGIQILVVDDDDNTREFLAFLLELHGANVIATASAAEAITALTQFKLDVLLSDIGMPDVDGYMLMRQVRALPPEQGGTIPAIALTAYAGEIDYQQAMAAGFQRHITKPIEPQALIQAISALCNSTGTLA